LRYLITGELGLLVHTWQSGFSYRATTWFCSTTSRPAASKHSPSQVLRRMQYHWTTLRIASARRARDDADVIVHLAPLWAQTHRRKSRQDIETN